MLIKINSQLYPQEAIINTCYAFIDRAYIFLDKGAGKSIVKVSIKAKKSLSAKQAEILQDEFMNELIFNSARYQISKNNKKIREYIVAKALYSTLSESDVSSSKIQEINKKKLDYLQDPLGIALPWEEKYGRKNEKAKI